ncbi:hypothetical protein AA313_de0204171 [Arthrobotrys entomopaga]|nr:hypothetical protein AA313_de0204171 [Arthrobotrys entomopaga]
MYERINYYRLILWNRLPPKIQIQYWQKHYQDEDATQNASSFSVKEDSETVLRLGFQQDQRSSASGEPSEQDGTGKDKSTKKTTIIGAGDGFMWDLMHGHLAPNTLPWANNAGLKPEELPYSLAGLSSAKNSLAELDAAKTSDSPPLPPPDAGVRGIFGALLDRIRRRPKMKSKPKPLTQETSAPPSNDSSDHSSLAPDVSIPHESSLDQIATTDKLATTPEQDLNRGSEDDTKDETASEMSHESPKDHSADQPLATSTPETISQHSIDSIASHALLDIPPQDVRRVEFEVSPTSTPNASPDTSMEGGSASGSNQNSPEGSDASERYVVTEIMGVDGKRVIIYNTDELVPFKFYSPFEDGVLEEHCVKLLRPGRKSPIMLRAKQIYIPKGAGNTSQWKEIEAQMENQKAEENEMVEQENDENQEERVDELSMVNEVIKPLPKSKSVMGTMAKVTEERTSDLEDENVPDESNRPLEVIEEEPETPPKPKPKRGRKPGTAKRKMEDDDYETPPQPKKRGRKKKVDPDDLPFTEDNMDMDLVAEDAMLDAIEEKPAPKKTPASKKTPGRPRRNCTPKDLKEI